MNYPFNGSIVKLVDGEESRFATVIGQKQVNMQTWLLLKDQSEEFGYCFKATKVEWNGSQFIYDCQKHETFLSDLRGMV